MLVKCSVETVVNCFQLPNLCYLCSKRLLLFSNCIIDIFVHTDFSCDTIIHKVYNLYSYKG